MKKLDLSKLNNNELDELMRDILHHHSSFSSIEYRDLKNEIFGTHQNAKLLLQYYLNKKDIFHLNLFFDQFAIYDDLITSEIIDMIVFDNERIYTSCYLHPLFTKKHYDHIIYTMLLMQPDFRHRCEWVLNCLTLCETDILDNKVYVIEAKLFEMHNQYGDCCPSLHRLSQFKAKINTPIPDKLLDKLYNYYKSYIQNLTEINGLCAELGYFLEYIKLDPNRIKKYYKEWKALFLNELDIEFKKEILTKYFTVKMQYVYDILIYMGEVCNDTKETALMQKIRILKETKAMKIQKEKEEKELKLKRIEYFRSLAD